MRRNIIIAMGILLIVAVSVASYVAIYMVFFNNNRIIKKTAKTVSSSDFPVSLTSPNKYKIDGDTISLTYDNGAKWSDVPVPITTLMSKKELSNITNYKDTYLANGSYFITPKVTAFVYGGDNEAVKLLISNNQGKSWNTFKIPGTASDEDYSDKYIGFTSESHGYVLLTSSVAMGHQENNIYETNDGGKTWKEIGNTNKAYARVVTGVGFTSDKTILVGFRYENDNNPTIYRTIDNGITWTKVNIKLPSQYESDYATPLCPVFQGANGVLPVKLRDNNKTIQFTTTDYGEIWKFDKTITK